MKALIERSSDFEQPCVGAYQVNVPEEGLRNTSILELWAIDIKNLAELLALIDEVGHKIIISKSNSIGFDFEIEIYDGYRE